VEAARGPEPAYRRAAAELLGLVSTELECQAALADLLRDPDPEVARAAIVSAGRTKRRDLIPRLIELAGDRRLKTEAREALAAFGLDILPGLQKSLLDSRLPLTVRRNLPRVFSTVGGQLAADYLAGCLQQPDLLLEYQILRALSRIRLKNPETRFDLTRINSLILNELRGQYRFVSIREGVGRDGTAGVRFLGRALEERLDRKLGNIFRLIALLYPPKEILDAYYGVTSGRRDLRANAVEFLDSVLQSPLRQMLLPIIEDRSPDWVLEYARMQLGIERRSHREALRDLLLESDPWLQSCAVYAAADQGLEGLGPLLESLVNAGDELLQETALAARRRLNPSPASPPGASWKT
jgi:AAA family ATP:ADP antiporter